MSNNKKVKTFSPVKSSSVLVSKVTINKGFTILKKHKEDELFMNSFKNAIKLGLIQRD